MFKRPALLVLFLIFIGNSCDARFVFNERCISAYDKILSLRLQEGQALLNAEKKANPTNSIPILLENYIDFLHLLTSERKDEFEKFKVSKNARIDKLQSEDQKSPYYLYCQAEINLQSCINRFKFQEYVSGVYELQKAYKQLEDNRKKFPDFLPNQKSFALLYSLLGLVPDQYKWALSTIGLKGNIQQGMNMLDELRIKLPQSPYAQFTNETIFFLSFIQMSVENQDHLYETVIRNTNPIGNEHLMNVYIRTLVAMRTGHTDEAIDFLEDRPKSAAYASFYYLDYLMGLAKLSRFDDDANQHFEFYLKNYAGCFNIKDSYLKLAWYYLLRGNTEKYNAYIGLCKVRGYTYSEREKDAYNQSMIKSPPDIHLLKARLYFDGGYQEKALAAIKGMKLDDFGNERERLEYLYRLGRIYQAMNRPDMAIQYYTSAISRGLELPYYYSANSSLQLGYIFENKKNYNKARYYFDLCLKMKNEEYKNSIDSKAKAGLRRIPGE